MGYEVTEDAVEKLCCDIIKFRNEMGLPKRDVVITQLMNWKLLKRENDFLLASNAMQSVFRAEILNLILKN